MKYNNILIAPDSFKGGVSSVRFCEIVSEKIKKGSIINVGVPTDRARKKQKKKSISDKNLIE